MENSLKNTEIQEIYKSLMILHLPENQPRSQGLSLTPPPRARERETLVRSGHVPPGQMRT